MKNERQIALNRSFVALIVSSMLALVAWWFDKPLFHAMELPGYSLPQISIWWLVPIVTLVTFGISYLSVPCIKEKYLPINILVVLGGIAGILIVSIVQLAPTTIFRILVLLNPVISIILGCIYALGVGDMRGLIFGPISTIFFGPLVILTHLLLYFHYSIAEAIGLSMITGIVLTIANVVINSIFPFLVALVERMIMIGKTPEFNGIKPPVQET